MTLKVQLLLVVFLLFAGFAAVRNGGYGSAPVVDPPAQTAQAGRPPDIHQDETIGAEWIRRLERPSRIPGLRIADVIAALQLEPGDVVACAHKGEA